MMDNAQSRDLYDRGGNETAQDILAAKYHARRVLSWAIARAQNGDCPICGGGGGGGYVYLNRDWLGTLSTAEFVAWIKSDASKMSDAELLKWLEEKHETD